MNGSDAVPNFRPNVIVAQCLIGVKMPTVKVLQSCLSRTRAGRVCNRGREASSDSRSRAPNRPSVEGWSTAGTIVRKTSRADQPPRADDNLKDA